MLSEMESTQFQNLYSSALFSSLSFHLGLFAAVCAAERLANIDSGPYLPKLAFRQLCAKLTFETQHGDGGAGKPRRDSRVEDLEGR